jgi:ribosomal RNA assembly protein
MDRIAVIIGKNGSVKQQIEEKTHTEIEIDSKTGDVLIKRKEEDVDSNIGDWVAQNVIKAVARGFNPEISLKLVDDEYLFEIIDLERVVGRAPNQLVRIKSRLIGEGGKAWKTIESLAGVNISIYGNTIALIGKYEEMGVAKEAINRLLAGQTHAAVFKYLQKMHDELKRKQETSLWQPGSPSP